MKLEMDDEDADDGPAGKPLKLSKKHKNNSPSKKAKYSSK
jgi:hypothetical protein